MDALDLNELRPKSWLKAVGLKTDPDYNKLFEYIVAKTGTNISTHPVTTEDGYILNVFRINSKQTRPGTKINILIERLVVFIYG